MAALQAEADAAIAAQATAGDAAAGPDAAHPTTFPSAPSAHREEDDLAAVAAGVRPAAWVSWSSKPLWRPRCAGQPTDQATPTDFCRGPAGREVIVGLRANVRRLLQLMESRHIRDDTFDREVARALRTVWVPKVPPQR